MMMLLQLEEDLNLRLEKTHQSRSLQKLLFSKSKILTKSPNLLGIKAKK